MRGTLILSLAIALIAVIFALQNAYAVEVGLGPFDFRAPLALVLLLTLFTGVLVGYLSTLSRALRMGSELRRLRERDAPAAPEPHPPSAVPGDEAIEGSTRTP